MAEIPAEQQQHRDAFGRAITIWMKHNGWSQQTLHDWSVAAGQAGGVWNSQVSLLQRGRLDPKPQFWLAIGAFNAAIAAQQFPYVTNRSLRDRLTNAEPFITNDGDVAAASELFAMFIGEAPLPERYAASALEPITDKEAKKLSEELRKQFRAIAQAQMLSPAEAWSALELHCSGMDADQQARFREVLSGWSDFNGEEATTLAVPGQPSKPVYALSAWAA